MQALLLKTATPAVRLLETCQTVSSDAVPYDGHFCQLFQFSWSSVEQARDRINLPPGFVTDGQELNEIAE